MVNRIGSVYAEFKQKVLLKNQFEEEKKRVGVIFLVFFFLTIILTSIYYKNNLVDKLDQSQLIPKEEGFTELYFENYTEISHVAPSAGDKIPISFVINNLEGSEKSYDYVIYFQNNEKKFLIDKGSVYLKNKQNVNIREKYLFRGSYPKGQIVVEIINSNQEIRFLLG